MTLSNNAAESLGKFIFQNAVTASTILADLNATAGSVTSLSLALHTADPGIGGSQTTSEASYTGYARQTVSRTSGNWPFTSPNIFENGVTITFPTNTGTAQTVSWLSIGSNTTNRVIFRLPLALETPKPFVLSDTTADEILCPAHGYSAGQEVVFVDTEGAALPTGITEGTTYYVRTTGLTADKFTISDTGAGGSAVAITAQGAGLICKISQKSIGTNDNLVFDTTNKITVILR
jgi:hypothetical protein